MAKHLTVSETSLVRCTCPYTTSLNTELSTLAMNAVSPINTNHYSFQNINMLDNVNFHATKVGS